MNKRDLLEELKPQLNLLKQNGLNIIKTNNKPLKVANPTFTKWLILDWHGGSSREDVLKFLTHTKANYQFEAINWFYKFYDLWMLAIVEYESKLPQEDANTFLTIANPFPYGFDPSSISRSMQEISFHSLTQRLYFIQKKEEKKKLLNELVEDTTLIKRISEGELLPIKYTQIMNPDELLFNIIPLLTTKLNQILRSYGIDYENPSKVITFLDTHPEYSIYLKALHKITPIER